MKDWKPIEISKNRLTANADELVLQGILLKSALLDAEERHRCRSLRRFQLIPSV
jgi:hypothetical protein